MDPVKKKISDFLARHYYLRLGTVTAACTPQVHTVGYVAEDCLVYFITDKKSRKAENIYRNPAVSYAVDENYEDLLAIQGVQMEGRASQVTGEAEAKRLLGLIMQKFSGMGQIPANPNLVFFRIEPSRGYFLDNSISFGHRDMVEF